MKRHLPTAAILAVVVCCGLLTAGCASTPAASPAAATRIRTVASATNPLTDVGGPLIVAVGDVACPAGDPVTTTTCRQAATAAQARAYHPHRVFLLGDMQYDAATDTEIRNSYNLTWGSLKPITRPVPGNHEYKTSGATGYYRYFADRTSAPGYYAFNVNNWRIYALNSNCDKIDCAAENAWLDRDMNRYPRACTALLMHHPLYSSGFEHGDSPEGRRFWVTALHHHADFVLAGHDHDYERFRKMNASGRAVPNGLVSFVVGTGGKSLYHSLGLRAGSQVYDAHRAGVLALRLGTRRYGWKFRTIDGKTIDQGVRSCG